eukprot:CAMPEP_0194421736 /NCGR_PEP_ID=MMETSP0176-20130528/20993_1 /TAXON_ID=216777 /ORGANISM="Proboscia alata, Strain PI-D3" /LENGTH=34 /DNA_ID= /DNA_START= /DNA_END= /DNA_ORIENTATION=
MIMIVVGAWNTLATADWIALKPSVSVSETGETGV